MNIAIIGANGQLGSDLLKIISSKHQVTGLSHKDIEITDMDSVLSALADKNYQVVINTAAFHNVPECEKQPEAALKGNVLGPRYLAECCNEIGARLIHFSTDYVFDGEKKNPYLEKDQTNPLNFYALTKLAGENAVKSTAKQWQIVRVSGIYGKVPSRAKGGKNFVKTMIELSDKHDNLTVVSDEITCPSSTIDIARQTLEIMKIDENAIIHAAQQGHCSWFDFAVEIFRILGKDIKITPVSASEFPSSVNRPSYSVLENGWLKQHGIDIMSSWQDALKEHLQLLK